MNLVAFPTATGKTPVAIGSRVPVCPVFFSLVTRLTIAPPINDVIPAGLSSIINPVITILQF